MKRTPLLIAIVAIEIVAGVIIYNNIQYLFRQTEQSYPPTINIAPQPQPTAEGIDRIEVNQEPALELESVLLSFFAPLPEQAAPTHYSITGELVDLGRILYYDPRLSINQEMSCNTCHPLDQYGMDGLSVSNGHNGLPGKRNAQSVYNAAFHIAQFWDGRSPNVEEQSKMPILDGNEMGMPEPAYVEQIVRSIPGYGPLFTTAFPDEAQPITFDNIGRAIGAFERGLMTQSRFDQFLAGDRAQLTAQEQRGLVTFVSLGCTSCHMGVTVGGLLYKKLGEIIPYQTEDLGRYNITHSELDRHVFKVASLRNVAKTAPYLHDGSIATLEEMVVLMAKHQLGKDVTQEQIADIIAFLHSLTGQIPADYIAPPQLPENGPDTPGPFRQN